MACLGAGAHRRRFNGEFETDGQKTPKCTPKWPRGSTGMAGHRAILKPISICSGLSIMSKSYFYYLSNHRSCTSVFFGHPVLRFAPKRSWKWHLPCRTAVGRRHLPCRTAVGRGTFHVEPRFAQRPSPCRPRSDKERQEHADRASQHTRIKGARILGDRGLKSVVSHGLRSHHARVTIGRLPLVLRAPLPQ